MEAGRLSELARARNDITAHFDHCLRQVVEGGAGFEKGFPAGGQGLDRALLRSECSRAAEQVAKEATKGGDPIGTGATSTLQWITDVAKFSRTSVQGSTAHS